jgi:hypothetical protein
MPRSRILPIVLVCLAVLVALAGCGSSKSGSASTAVTTTAQTTTTTSGGAQAADPRLALATAANDLGDYCLSKLHGTATRIDPKDAVDRIIAAYHASGEDPKLREALRLVGTSLAKGVCYKAGAARVQAAVGAASSP